MSDSNFVAAKKNGFACSSRSGNEVPRPILFFVATKKNGPPAAAVAATSSATDSNLRCLEGDQKLNARPTPLLVAPSDRLGVLPFLSGFTYVLL